HQRLLRDAVAVHGGQEVKWTGDGLMTTFASSADAVRCAVAMQQTTRVRAAGERLAMRAGLHVGEALRDDSDWVGASVVVARRLCDRAAAGQILCSGLVVELLNGRRAFQFGEIGALELKGFAAPVAAYEVQYDADDPAAVLRHTPFTGRAAELARLERRLEEARGSRGGVAMLVGEPGIGKTRTLEEFVETARAQEALVLWGRCYEGEAARPYEPFAEAIAEYARKADAETLRADLGPRAPCRRSGHVPSAANRSSSVSDTSSRRTWWRCGCGGRGPRPRATSNTTWPAAMASRSRPARPRRVPSPARCAPASSVKCPTKAGAAARAWACAPKSPRSTSASWW